MMGRIVRIGMAALLMTAAACEKGAAPDAQRNAGSVTNATAPAPRAEPIKAVVRPAPTYTLAGNGLSPDLKFGMKQAEAIAAATRAFGPPGKPEHNDECGEGPMDFVAFHGLQLGFQDGKLAGWSLSGKTPALKTAGGIGIGTPRSALKGVEIDEQSSLGPEFAIDEVGGILGEDNKVEALWAGYPCQFR